MDRNAGLRRTNPISRLLQRSSASRLTAQGQVVSLIAETGGQNAMVVDSSALVEQAVADIVSSAFDSAGQRCSALRLLCVQGEVADRLLAMLQGAVQELRIGDPCELATDVGPVIDAQARDMIEHHVHTMHANGKKVWRAALNPALVTHGCFVAPTIIEINSVSDLKREVFGPVLHVLRYAREDLADVLNAINATGNGLTFGVHTRIDETVAQAVSASHAGNIYVNRNVVGAVVGVQPFGGEGLSGTGPKAGGPLYLLRLLAQRPVQAARLAVASSSAAPSSAIRSLPSLATPSKGALDALCAWAQEQGQGTLAAQCNQAAAESPVCGWTALAGPTGEANLYAVQPRGKVLCLASGPTRDADLLAQLSAVLAVGNHALWPANSQALYDRLPSAVRDRITVTQDWTKSDVKFDAALCHGSPADLLALAQTLAKRPGPIISLTGLKPGETRIPIERLVIEKSLSINTAAAGGNASLMTLE